MEEVMPRPLTLPALDETTIAELRRCYETDPDPASRRR
jgi:hypothetical protein